MSNQHNLARTHWVSPTEAAVEEEITKPKTRMGKVFDLLFDFLQSIALGGAFFVVVYLFVVQPHQVKGNSMYPTYKDKEYILTDKVSYKFKLPQRGDIIILESPNNPDIDYIKRVIALPGETIKIEGGSVYLNGQELSEVYLQVETPLFPGGFIKEGVEVTVPQNNIFVMGDNRPGSSDSRDFGFVPYEHIIGRVFFRYFPVDRFGTVEKAGYLR